MVDAVAVVVGLVQFQQDTRSSSLENCLSLVLIEYVTAGNTKSYIILLVEPNSDRCTTAFFFCLLLKDVVCWGCVFLVHLLYYSSVIGMGRRMRVVLSEVCMLPCSSGAFFCFSKMLRLYS